MNIGGTSTAQRGIDDDTHRSIGALPRGRGILGVLIDSPRALRIPNVGDHVVYEIVHDSLIVVRTGPDEIRAWCKERLAAYKYPREVRVVAALPKGPTGKILKKELR